MGLFRLLQSKHAQKAADKAAREEKNRANASDYLREALLNAIDFQKTEAEAPLPFGSSKIGGKPQLPRDFVWPYFAGENYNHVCVKRPLSFLAQIHLDEIASLDTDNRLPHTGYLYFFYELETMCWGFDPADNGCARVFYYDATPDELVEWDYPSDLAEEYRVPTFSLSFRSLPCVPAFEEAVDDPQVLVDWDTYDRLAAELGVDTQWEEERDLDLDPIFRLLGHAYLLQDSILPECVQVDAGYSDREWGDLSDTQRNEYKESEKDWVLLAQFGTIDDAILFGDCGYIYFYIRKEDLKERRFDRIHLSLQCG